MTEMFNILTVFIKDPIKVLLFFTLLTLGYMLYNQDKTNKNDIDRLRKSVEKRDSIIIIQSVYIAKVEAKQETIDSIIKTNIQ